MMISIGWSQRGDAHGHKPTQAISVTYEEKHIYRIRLDLSGFVLLYLLVPLSSASMKNDSAVSVAGKDFLTLKEAAAIIRVSESMMFRLCREPIKKTGLKVIRIRGSNRIRIPTKLFLKWAGLAEG